MSPLKDSFGEEWVEMDDKAKDVNTCKPGETSVGAKKEASEPNEHESNYAEKTDDVRFKKASIPLSQLEKKGKSQVMISSQEKNLKKVGEGNNETESVHSAKGFRDSFNRDDKDRRQLKSMELHNKKGGLGSKCEQFTLGEQKSDMQPSKHGLKDIPLMKKNLEECPRPRPGRWEKGREKKPPLLRRVMSESRFMQGQVMVGKRESVQGVLSRGHSSKAKKGTKSGDMEEEALCVKGKREKNEETLVEVEVTIKKTSSMELKAVMEGDETVILRIPPRSLSDTYMHRLPLEPVQVLQVVAPDMHLQFMGSKDDQDMHRQDLQAPQCSLKKPLEAMDDAHAHSQYTSKEKEAVSSTSDGNGVHLNRAKEGPKVATGMEEKPLQNFGKVHTEAKASKMLSKAKEVLQRSIKPLEIASNGEESLQKEKRGRKQDCVGQLEATEVECECCGVEEECTTGYIEHVKGMFSGHWVCGLCAEAVHEERHRLGRGVPMEEAVRTHMNMCKQFSSEKRAGEPPHSPGVAHAVCHLLSRHLSDPPTSPRQPATGSIRPVLSRTSSCLASFSQNPPCSIYREQSNHI